MALSDIAHGFPAGTFAGALALRKSNPVAFRTALLAKIKQKFPQVTLADLQPGGNIIAVYHQPLAYWGIGRGLIDAADAAEAAWQAANPGATLPVGAG